MSAGTALDTIGMSEGTDKTSLGNDYLRHYGRMLEPFRDAEVNIFEIGVGFGGSLKSYRRFFTAATIAALDIEAHCARFHDPDNRIHVYIGSQTDTEILDRICDAHPPAVIIDDGSHHADHQFISLNHLWPKLAPGGCYIVEDIFFQMYKDFYSKYRGPTQESILDFLSVLAVDRSGGQITEGPHRESRAAVVGSLDRMEFFRGAVALWKTETPRDIDDHVALVRRTLERSSGPLAWENLFNYLRSRHRPLPELLAIAEKARDASGDHIFYHNRVADLYAGTGDLDAAILEMEKSFGHPHTPEWAEQQHARIAALRERKAAV